MPVFLPMLLAAAAPGLIQAGASYIGGKKRNERLRDAESAYDSDLEDYMDMNFENNFANMENPMEDLTVNTQAADFQMANLNQSSADLLGGMRQAAGGSGVAALAQAIANNQARQTSQISAGIGQQEAANTRAMASAEMNLNQLEAQGANQVQAMNFDRLGTRVGMSQAELAGAYDAKNMAYQARMAAFGNVASGISNNAQGLAQAFNTDFP